MSVPNGYVVHHGHAQNRDVDRMVNVHGHANAHAMDHHCVDVNDYAYAPQHVLYLPQGPRPLRMLYFAQNAFDVPKRKTMMKMIAVAHDGMVGGRAKEMKKAMSMVVSENQARMATVQVHSSLIMIAFVCDLYFHSS
jgi:hypothetical protein